MMDKDILTRTMGADVAILMSDKIDYNENKKVPREKVGLLILKRSIHQKI